jgi:predicted DNA-binding transcriptional regulator YafY
VIDSGTLTLTAACHDHERLRFDYRDHSRSASLRIVEPHRLVNWDRRWPAWDTERQDWRTFRRPDRPPHPGRRHGGSRRRAHCVLDTGADSVDTLAVYLGTLGADFTVSEPPELVVHLRELSDRYHRGTH